jgi:uncharacterized NAD(P)/FAD-binding protein YdhS
MPMDYAIIGAGFSGTALALACSQYPNIKGRIHVFERRQTFAQGVAYATSCDRHVLNVPAGRMAAYQNLPHHLTDWLTTHHYADPTGEALPHSYIPRRLYGQYLQEQLTLAERAQPGRFIRHQDDVVALENQDTGMVVHTASGALVPVSQVALCTGYLPPRPPKVAGSALLVPPLYVADPWDEAALARLGPNAQVALLGAGLTMVDVALKLTDPLAAVPFTGTLTAVSRHGLMPQAHLQALSPIAADAGVDKATTARELLHLMRARVRAHQAQGGDWRQVIDSLRGQTSALWQRLGALERARFLRHGKAQWDVHRHRVAPGVSHALHALRRQGTLTVMGGRLMGVAAGARPGSLRVTWRRRSTGKLWHQEVQGLVNCTGGHSDAQALGSALWSALQNQGLIRAGPHGMGLDVDPDGRVVRATGAVNPRLWTLGPLAVGRDFESVAVPEIRAQAARLAAHWQAF